MSPKYLRKYRIPDENWGLDPSQYDDDIDLLIVAAASEGIELGELGPKVEQLIAARFLELEGRANRRVVAKVTRDGLAAILIKHPLP